MVIIPYHECVNFDIFLVHDNTFSPSPRCAFPLNKPYEVFWHFSTGDGKTTACFLLVGIRVLLGDWLDHTPKYHRNGGLYCSLKRSSSHLIGCSDFFPSGLVGWLWCPYNDSLVRIHKEEINARSRPSGGFSVRAAVSVLQLKGGIQCQDFHGKPWWLSGSYTKPTPKTNTVMVSFKVFFLEMKS